MEPREVIMLVIALFNTFVFGFALGLSVRQKNGGASK